MRFCKPLICCCFCKCKDTKLKAIHNNTLQIISKKLVVFANAKILNWKQFTTSQSNGATLGGCFCKCKDTKLKAIHNKSAEKVAQIAVVFANAKILNWKQFTTAAFLAVLPISLFLQMQRY